MAEMRLFDTTGNRLYINQDEVGRLLEVCKESYPLARTFVETLVYTGCRISEGLNLVPKSIQYNDNLVVFNSLKKRRGDVFRSVPVPKKYIDTMKLAHQIPQRQRTKSKIDKPLWSWGRQHAHEVVKNLMIKADIPPGKHRTAKGLRHAFGVNAISKDVPLNMLQKWMGHADITTTAIYANAIGKEEALIANKMWNR